MTSILYPREQRLSSILVVAKGRSKHAGVQKTIKASWIPACAADGSVKRSLPMGPNACETARAHDALEVRRNPLETDMLIW